MSLIMIFILKTDASNAKDIIVLHPWVQKARVGKMKQMDVRTKRLLINSQTQPETKSQKNNTNQTKSQKSQNPKQRK